MFKKHLLIIFCAFVLLFAGCAPEDGGADQGSGMNGNMNNGTHEGQGINPDGGANEGIVQGKGHRSLYTDQSRNGNDTRSAPFFNRDGKNGNNRFQNRSYKGDDHNGEQALFGFVEHADDDPDVIYQGYGAQTYIDRQLLADTISQVVVGMPDVETASVFVGDEDCIIGFSGSGNREDLARNVELSGQSVTPRWFKVYATDDPQIIDSLRDIAQTYSGGNSDIAQINAELDRIIQHLGGPKESWEQPGAAQDQTEANGPSNRSNARQGNGTDQSMNDQHENERE